MKTLILLKNQRQVLNSLFIIQNHSAINYCFLFSLLQGFQYLQYVLYERSKTCPEVVHVRPPPKKIVACRQIEKVFIEKDTEIPISQRHSTVEWQTIQIQSFSELRDKINELRRLQNISPEKLPHLDQINEWKKFCQQNKPLLRLVLSIPTKSLESLLEYLLCWLQESTEDKMEINSNAWLTLWIYACLAYIFVPLDPNVYSILREIAKTCRILREKNIEPGLNISYSLIICIISTYFRQLDLTDTFNN